jgi:hypothetical protein
MLAVMEMPKQQDDLLEWAVEPGRAYRARTLAQLFAIEEPEVEKLVRLRSPFETGERTGSARGGRQSVTRASSVL